MSRTNFAGCRKGDSGVYTVNGNHTYAEESAANHPGSNPYTITVTRNFRVMTPLMGRFIGGGQDLTLRAVAQGRQNCSGGC